MTDETEMLERQLLELLDHHLSREDRQRLSRALINFGRRIGRGRRPGRPPRADVSEALRLEACGVSRKEIYRRLGKVTRDEQHAMREAMRLRRYRARRKLSPTIDTPRNAPEVCTG